MTERLLAELDDNGTVRRVIVCDSIEWAEEHLGGRWVETRYDDPTEKYAGIGDGHDPTAPERFAPALDDRTLARLEPAETLTVWRDGKIARGTVAKIAGDLRIDLDAVRAEIEIESPVEVVKRPDSPA